MATQLEKTETDDGVVHSYTQEEKAAIVEHINALLKGDNDLEHLLPIDPNTDSIFEAVRDGVLLW